MDSKLQSVVPKVFAKSQNLSYILSEQSRSNPHFCDPKRAVIFLKCVLKSFEKIDEAYGIVFHHDRLDL